MTPQRLREAVVRSAAAQRLVVERALTARIVADVADEPGGLPLMAHALREIWRRRTARTPRGRIVLVGSVAGHIHTPGNIYGATKWAVTGLAENTRRQVTEFGVGVTLISPGRVETPFWDSYGSLPPGHLLTADQLAESIVWAIGQPEGVDVNTVVVRPLGQPV
jgi:NADP-dependent 3-hydroxy acid dehydrogenase YdfG